MGQTNVLVVDDSAIARRMIAAELGKLAGIDSVATAASGVIALTRIEQSPPDIVVLDLEMPDMDGIETLVRIRALSPGVPVIMFSSLTERGARVTFDALAKGATDYVLKPVAARGESLESVVATVLGPKITSIMRARLQSAVSPIEPITKRMSQVPVTSPTRVPPMPVAQGPSVTPQAVVIASSTGGPNALAEVLPRLTPSFPVPVVIVQHMPPVFTRCLAERLDIQSNVRVEEARGGEILRPGVVLIAPGGDQHLEIVRDGGVVRTRLVDGPPENSCRPAADVLFRSAAQAYGPELLALVMTGMGEDGLAGSREIVRCGGRIIAQSGPTCVVWGMPRAVETAGLCSAIVPLPDLAGYLDRAVASGRRDLAEPERHWSC